MNLKLATLLFIASSASARNLRASKPRRYLAAHSSSSSSDEVSTFRAFCTIPQGCDIDADELQEISQKALDDFNSSSSSSSNDRRKRRHLSSSSGSSEDFQLRLDESCTNRAIEKQFESEMSSAYSSSKSRSRIRRLQPPSSSSSSSETDMDVKCFREVDLENARSACGDAGAAAAIAREVAGHSRGRNLSSGESEVEILSVPTILSCDPDMLRTQLEDIINFSSSSGGSRE